MKKLNDFVREVGFGGWLLLAATMMVLCWAAVGGYWYPSIYQGEIREFNLSEGSCWVAPCWRLVHPRLTWEQEIAHDDDRLTVEGSDNWVTSVSFSPDGTLIVSGVTDGTVRLWDVESGEGRVILRGHNGRVMDVSFSPDGNLIVSGGEDSTVQLWDAKSGEALASPWRHEGGVRSVSFSPDGNLIVSGGEDGTVRLWDVKSGEERVIPWGHEGGVRSASFSPDGTLIVSAGKDGMVRLGDVESREEIGMPWGHEDGVRSASFSPDGTLIVSGGEDRTVRLWDVESREEIAILRGHDNWVRRVSFSPNGGHLVSGSSDGTVRLWDVESREEVAFLRPSQSRVRSVAFGPDGRRLVSGGEDGTVRLWNREMVALPLLIWIVLVYLAGNLIYFVRLLLPTWRRVQESADPRDPAGSTVPNIERDSAIDRPELATEAMSKVVKRISRFVRNPDASAPFTFALIGKWGSGKSSLMKLVERDLREDCCPYVWFNAWHHQNETHLFAALMESIRRNAVPRSLRLSLEFYWNLVQIRYRKANKLVVLLKLLVVVCLTVGFISQSLPDSDFVAFLLTHMLELSSAPPTLSNTLSIVSPGLAVLVLIIRWNPLKAFGVTPASLVRASAARIQFPRFRDRLSFRDQFGHAFGDVCEAFNDRHLVIIIDDLDRCRPEQVVEILEAMNFLMSNGECFVLLGIDESQVKRAIGLQYKDIAEEMARENKQLRTHCGINDDDNFEARQDYADHYLEKLINLKVTVPIVDERDLSKLNRAGRS